MLLLLSMLLSAIYKNKSKFDCYFDSSRIASFGDAFRHDRLCQCACFAHFFLLVRVERVIKAGVKNVSEEWILECAAIIQIGYSSPISSLCCRSNILMGIVVQRDSSNALVAQTRAAAEVTVSTKIAALKNGGKASTRLNFGAFHRLAHLQRMGLNIFWANSCSRM